MKVLAIGAGAAAHCGAVPTILALARTADVSVSVIDRAALRPDHLQHPIYRGHGEPGLPKAIAVAARLRDAGIHATALCGNLTRWPLPTFRADLALVGLDSESARGAAHRRLRAAGTPTLVASLSDVVGIHVFGATADDACYQCSSQRFVPADSTPCVPGRHAGVSTRRAASFEALRVLGQRLPALSREALAGREFGTYHVVIPGCYGLRALLGRHMHCAGDHRPRPVPAAACSLPAQATLALLFATVGADAQLLGCNFRLNYTCRNCGRSDQHGRELVRAWPARERCACGSTAVEPLLRLGAITRREAEGQSLLHESLQDLGVPPGAELLATGPDGAIAVHVGSATGAPEAQGVLS